jgi:hypothetical protein
MRRPTSGLMGCAVSSVLHRLTTAALFASLYSRSQVKCEMSARVHRVASDDDFCSSEIHVQPSFPIERLSLIRTGFGPVKRHWLSAQVSFTPWWFMPQVGPLFCCWVSVLLAQNCVMAWCGLCTMGRVIFSLWAELQLLSGLMNSVEFSGFWVIWKLVI